MNRAGSRTQQGRDAELHIIRGDAMTKPAAPGSFVAGTAGTPAPKCANTTDDSVHEPGNQTAGLLRPLKHLLLSKTPYRALLLATCMMLAAAAWCNRFEESFGDGRDGDLTISAGETVVMNPVNTKVLGDNPAGQCWLRVASVAGFAAGDEVLIMGPLKNV